MIIFISNMIFISAKVSELFRNFLNLFRGNLISEVDISCLKNDR